MHPEAKPKVGVTVLLFPSFFPFPSLSFPALDVGPLNPAEGSRERRELPQRKQAEHDRPPDFNAF